MFQYTEIKKYPCIESWRFKNFRILYTQVFLKSEITTDDENILGCESGNWVLRIYLKNRVRKSHATVPLMQQSCSQPHAIGAENAESAFSCTSHCHNCLLQLYM